MPEVFVKPYVPDQQNVDQLYYPSYLPTEFNYSQYASLPQYTLSPPNVIIDQPSLLPIEHRYDPWEAVAAQVRKKYPQQERPIPLLGTGGVERYQTWPERTIRSALTLPVETYQGAVQSGPGLRREDVTDIPGQAQPLDPLMERAQDVAGLAGGTMFAGVPKGAATLGAGPVMRSESSRVGAPLTALEKAPMFYSAVENAVKGAKQNVASKEQWLSYLKNQQGVKPEEMQWTGLDKLPEGKITKQQLEQHIAENKVQFNEVWKGKFNKDVPLKAIKTDGGYWEIRNEQGQFLTNILENVSEQEALNIAKQRLESNDPAKIQRDETKFSQYSLPGGERYRELLLQLPNKPTGEFKSSHWDEPNVLAHIRMNDREIPNVGKSLHIEEIQSDWHQKGRKEGYKVSEAEKERMTKELQDIQMERSKLIGNVKKPEDIERYNELEKKELELIDKYNKSHDAVPDAPFKKTWDELAIKRVIRQAVEEGKDAISWTPGEAQAARYDLSKHVDKIKAYKENDGTYTITGTPINSRIANDFQYIGKNIQSNKLSELIGKDLAEKIINQKENEQLYSEIDLKVGGEGMKAFYDKMMIDKVNNLAKKYGGKVEQKEIKVRDPNTSLSFGVPVKPDEKHSIHVLKLTPELKEAALTKGFALFSETSKVGAPLSALEKFNKIGDLLDKYERQGVKDGVTEAPPELYNEYQEALRQKWAEEQGYTKEAYHGTTEPIEFTTFKTDRPYDLGAHFGTKEQAVERGTIPANADLRSYPPGATSRVIPVKLKLNNPLRMKDLGQWDYGKIRKELIRLGFDKNEIEKSLSNTKDYLKHNEELKKLIESKGYDGIVYMNREEGVKKAELLKKFNNYELDNMSDNEFNKLAPEAKDSYIAFKPEQIRSQFAQFKPGNVGKAGLLLSETSKVGAPLSALEKAGITPEVKSRMLPAIRNYETGKIETVSRGKSHEDLMMNYHQKSGGDKKADYMDIVNRGLEHNETGYYDPKTNKFISRNEGEGFDLDATELMTPVQLKKYEQNRLLWSSGLQFPKPLEQLSFNERWNERVPEDEFMQNKGIREYPTNRQAPGRHMENRPVRLTKVNYNPFE